MEQILVSKEQFKVTGSNSKLLLTASATAASEYTCPQLPYSIVSYSCLYSLFIELSIISFNLFQAVYHDYVFRKKTEAITNAACLNFSGVENQNVPLFALNLRFK